MLALRLRHQNSNATIISATETTGTTTATAIVPPADNPPPPPDPDVLDADIVLEVIVAASPADVGFGAGVLGASAVDVTITTTLEVCDGSFFELEEEGVESGVEGVEAGGVELGVDFDEDDDDEDEDEDEEEEELLAGVGSGEGEGVEGCVGSSFEEGGCDVTGGSVFPGPEDSGASVFIDEECGADIAKDDKTPRIRYAINASTTFDLISHLLYSQVRKWRPRETPTPSLNRPIQIIRNDTVSLLDFRRKGDGKHQNLLSRKKNLARGRMQLSDWRVEKTNESEQRMTRASVGWRKEEGRERVDSTVYGLASGPR